MDEMEIEEQTEEIPKRLAEPSGRHSLWQGAVRRGEKRGMVGFRLLPQKARRDPVPAERRYRIRGEAVNGRRRKNGDLYRPRTGRHSRKFFRNSPDD